MKAQERHHLKQNEFAETVARLSTLAREHRDRLLLGTVAVLVVIGSVSGVWVWRNGKRDQAGAAFARAMAVLQSQIAPAPTVPGATQAAGTYSTVQARQEAALKAFQEVAATYAASEEGAAAQYQAAGTLVSLGRLADAEKAYQDVIARAGASILAPMARLGLADALAAEGKFDLAIKEYTDMSAQVAGAVPLDAVLMQLAHAYVKAGKSNEARATFKRVVDEFPDSGYVAEARQQMTLISGV